MLREVDRWLALRYGGKRAWLRLIGERAAHAAGRYAGLDPIDWTGVARLVFVCSGNICRSPYGEAKARSLGVLAASFGLSADARSAVDPRARDVAARRGVDLSSHRVRGVAEIRLSPNDLLLLFEPSHAAVLQSQVPAELCVQVRPLGLWSSPVCPYIHDPFGLDERYFDACFARIDSAVARVAALLRDGQHR